MCCCDIFISHTWRTHATHHSFDVPTHWRVIRQGQKSPIFMTLFSKRVLFSWVSFAKESYFYKTLLQMRLHLTVMCPHNDEWFVKRKYSLINIMINIPHYIRIFAMANNIRTIHLYPHHSFTYAPFIYIEVLAINIHYINICIIRDSSVFALDLIIRITHQIRKFTIAIEIRIFHS